MALEANVERADAGLADAGLADLGAGGIRREALAAICEALLWASPTPLGSGQIAALLELPEERVKQALETIRQSYAEGGSGLQVQKVAGGYQITTRPELAPYIEKLARPKPQPLSQAALETLAVVAYMQPVTRAEIEAIRGVSADTALRTLIGRHLVQEVGRKQVVGRPLLYGTTAEFLRWLGLDDISQLPPLEEFKD